jgi:hypothetical protein
MLPGSVAEALLTWLQQNSEMPGSSFFMDNTPMKKLSEMNMKHYAGVQKKPIRRSFVQICAWW